MSTRNSRRARIFRVPHSALRVSLRAVAADGFDRAAFHGFLAELLLVRALRLLVEETVAAVVVALEIGGRGFAAEVSVDALIVHVEFATHVFGILVRLVGHGRIWAAKVATRSHSATHFFREDSARSLHSEFQVPNSKFGPPQACSEYGYAPRNGEAAARG